MFCRKRSCIQMYVCHCVMFHIGRTLFYSILLILTAETGIASIRLLLISLDGAYNYCMTERGIPIVMRCVHRTLHAVRIVMLPTFRSRTRTNNCFRGILLIY